MRVCRKSPRDLLGIIQGPLTIDRENAVPMGGTTEELGSLHPSIPLRTRVPDPVPRGATMTQIRGHFSALTESGYRRTSGHLDRELTRV